MIDSRTMAWTLPIILLLINVAAGRASAPATMPATAPSLPHIVLKGDAIPTPQLFHEITRDTGISFLVTDTNVWDHGPAAIDVDIDARFWPAVDKACRLCNVAVSEAADTSLQIVPGGNGIWGNR